MTFAFHSEARLEYVAAAKYYEERRSGLGARFSIEIEAAIQRVMEAPSRWPVLKEDVRRCLTHTFPYAIIYTIERDAVLILAVMHCSREPGYWRNRGT
jgi:toxin ParE1/3/4